MKLNEDQLIAFRKTKGDNEAMHSLYDAFCEKRLKELDPEFLEELQEEVKGVTFWYA